jgi:uncharacterized protein (DUF885 family)
VLRAEGMAPDYVAGHSLGEYSALVAAGSLRFADAVRLVRKRGQYMQAAVPPGVGAMAAILKLPEGKLDAVLAEAAQGEVVSAANLNSPDQVVIAGHAGAVNRAAELAKAAGARRAVLLPVSAPFHCALMAPAQERLRVDLDATEFRDLACPLVNNWQALDQAKTNLITSPEVWTRVAQQENEGNIGLIEGPLKADAPAAMKADYDKVAKPAVEALRAFDNWLKTDLATRLSDWRLGKTNYDLKFKYMLEVDKTPAEVLAEAEAELKVIQEKMAKLAAPLSIRAALDKIAKDHTTPENYLADARKDLVEATDFVRAKNLVPLLDTNNLKVVETPEFMRGLYGVGGFAAAPALEPQLGAFYWITPIAKGWPKERVESKLREYNTYGLQHLTVHEAMPGHYVQLEYANRLEPQSRRVLRNIYGNTPYVEGWAFYTQEMMADEGYLNNAPGFRMTLYKQILRGIGNAILDIRLHTMGMTDEQAMDLMLNQTFQEKEEATAKLQRAALSSSQLPCYFVGWKAWRQVRADYEKAQGGAFRLSSFHERALKESAVPLPVLGHLLSEK